MNQEDKMVHNSEQKPYRVLSLDGGGMRGLYTASLLNTLANRFGNNLDIGKGFDLIVGTSTGSILASGLAAGVSLKKVIAIYQETGKLIFQKPMPNNKLLKYIWALRCSINPANKNQPLINALQDVFGNETIGELYTRRNIGICIPTINMTTHKAQVFKTPHNPIKNADNNRLIVEACLASSAAPVIFPVARINDPNTEGTESYYVDGGLWANNPVQIALIESLQMSKQNQAIEIISIGSCLPPSGSSLTSSKAQRGLSGWNFGTKILEVSMDAQASGHQFSAEILAEHFTKSGKIVDIIRFDQTHPSAEQAKFLQLDNASQNACNTLIQLGNTDALSIHSQCTSGRNKFHKLNDIFQSMPTLCNEE